MSRWRLYILLLIIFFAPSTSHAAICSVEGYTTVYVNGIFTDKETAKADKALIEKTYQKYGKQELVPEVSFEVGYNPSHLGGGGDLLKTIIQKKYDEPKAFGEDHDLKNILLDLQGKIKTQRILLIGHSQGSFYTNALYEHLVHELGVPAKSIAVYNTGTPAAYVAGNGRYMTNANDNVINTVRDMTSRFGYPDPLAANTDIPTRPEDEGDKWRGHSLANVYLAERPTDISRDITRALMRLEADPTRDPNQPCIPLTMKTFDDKVADAAFVVGDVVGGGIRMALGGARSVGTKITKGLQDAFAAAYKRDQGGQGAAAILAVDGGEATEEQLPQTSTAVDEVELSEESSQESQAQEEATLETSVDETQETESPNSPSPEPDSAVEQSEKKEEEAPPFGFGGLTSFTPGQGAWGGGGGGGASVEEEPVSPAADTTAPAAPVVTNLSFPTTIATTSVTIEGNAEDGSTVTLVYEQGSATTTTTVSDGTFRFDVVLLVGDTTVTLTATDAAGNTSSETVGVITADLSPDLLITSPVDNSIHATTTVNLSGTTSALADIQIAYVGSIATTSADSLGVWGKALILAEGTTVIGVSAQDQEGYTSATSTITVEVDITPPSAPVVEISECEDSLSAAVCLLAQMSGSAEWGPVDDGAYYEIFLDGDSTATTSGSSMTVTLNTGANTIVVRAYDDAGNYADSAEVEVVVETQPVIINEVAWAGTDADSEHEWIELKNLSAYDIDMSKLVLFSSKDLFEVLSGTLPQASSGSTDIYLIERALSTVTTGDEDVSPVFDLLDDTGEQLTLAVVTSSATTTIDQTPAVETCGGWCAGALSLALRFSEQFSTVEGVRSMERIDNASDGTLAASWHSNDTYTKSASDALGGDIFGTPGTENSIGQAVAGWFCEPDTLSIASGSTYTPDGAGCYYLSGFIHQQARRYGGLYRGVPGAAEEIYVHSLGKNIEKLQTNDLSSYSDGETFFVGLWETRTGAFSDIEDFSNWFQYGTTTSGTTTPVHTNYRILEWVLGA